MESSGFIKTEYRGMPGLYGRITGQSFPAKRNTASCRITPCDLVKIGVEQVDDAVVVLRCSIANRPALQDFHIGKGKFYSLNAFPLNPCRHHKAVGAVVI